MRQLKNLTKVKNLAEAGLIEPEDIKAIDNVVREFSLGLSAQMQAQINEYNYNDPIYSQFVPHIDELKQDDILLNDPIGDEIHSPVKGLIHRYKNRVLVKLNNFCPVYCRFCFRRDSVGRGANMVLDSNQITSIIEYIKNHTEITEVILSGGDPLMLKARKLEDFSNLLREIDHVKILRLHSRVPVTLPQMIKPAVINALKESQKALILVLHINHMNEFNQDAENAINLLRNNGIMLLSQSVLLKGINDSPKVLAQLMQSFLIRGIKPYYLHHPDLARGTSHFQIDLQEGKAIYDELKKTISGIGLPRYVIDIPNGFGKIAINSDNVIALGNGEYILIDKRGMRHPYKNAA